MFYLSGLKVVLPPFFLTAAALEVHMIEEYLTRFGPAMSRLFNISWSEGSFLMIFGFIGPILYTLTALGLFGRNADHSIGFGYSVRFQVIRSR
jgi:hypothetical protein